MGTLAKMLLVLCLAAVSISATEGKLIFKSCLLQAKFGNGHYTEQTNCMWTHKSIALKTHFKCYLGYSLMCTSVLISMH